jgi:hypothetical protein
MEKWEFLMLKCDTWAMYHAHLSVSSIDRFMYQIVVSLYLSSLLLWIVLLSICRFLIWTKTTQTAHLMLFSEVNSVYCENLTL